MLQGHQAGQRAPRGNPGLDRRKSSTGVDEPVSPVGDGAGPSPSGPRGVARRAGLVRRSHCTARGCRPVPELYTKVGTTPAPRASRHPSSMLRSVTPHRRPPAAGRGRRLAGALALVVLVACAGEGEGRAGTVAGAALTEGERERIAEEVSSRLREATSLQAGGDVYGRLMSIYPDSGRVISASMGQVSTSRDSLATSVRAFWENVGRNMVNPEWRWGPMHVDVLSRDAAVVTATYRVPHLTPTQRPHVIGGAWTAVFVRRGDRWVVAQEHLSDHPGPMSPTPD